MHFSIRHRRKNQVPRIDGPEMVPRQCGDFWTVIYPGPPRAVEANPCKFRLLAGNRGLRASNLMPGFAVIQPYELIVTDEIMPAAALGLTGLTMNGPAPVAIEAAVELSFVLASAAGCIFSDRRQLAFRHQTFAAARQSVRQCLWPLSDAL
jgi:hypothetical protein